MQQIVDLDKVCQAKFEHIHGTVNSGANGVSQLHMKGLIQPYFKKPTDLIKIKNNVDFPLVMTRIREEQDQDHNLKALVHKKDDTISLTTIGGTDVYVINGKVYVPTKFQARRIK